MEFMSQLQARCLLNDLKALTTMGEIHQDGDCGSPKDNLKALDCCIRAVELGSPEACNNIAVDYREGVHGVAVNKERAALFARVGALRGDIVARHNIGRIEYHDFGNQEIAIRHWKIAAEAGHQDSLNLLKKIYNADGEMPGKQFISKECMDNLYRVCHDAQEEVKSEEREKHCNDVYNLKC